MSEPSLHPRQERSRRTRRKLLEAAAAEVGQNGIQGVKVADIATRAGVSVGNVYRRFPSKEALFDALEEEILARRDGFWQSFLDRERWAGRSLAELVQAVVDDLVRGHRRHAELLRALATQARPDYEARVPEVGTGPAAALAELILDLWPEEVSHARPRQAIALAFEMAAATVGELTLFRRGGAEGLGLGGEALAKELAHTVMAYLRA